MPSPLHLIGIVECFLIGLFAGAGWIVAAKLVALIGMLFH